MEAEGHRRASGLTPPAVPRTPRSRSGREGRGISDRAPAATEETRPARHAFERGPRVFFAERRASLAAKTREPRKSMLRAKPGRHKSRAARRLRAAGQVIDAGNATGLIKRIENASGASRLVLSPWGRGPASGARPGHCRPGPGDRAGRRNAPPGFRARPSVCITASGARQSPAIAGPSLRRGGAERLPPLAFGIGAILVTSSGTTPRRRHWRPETRRAERFLSARPGVQASGGRHQPHPGRLE